jgi:hypothetical protein
VQNAHRIRQQPNRPDHVAGVPNTLYFGREWLLQDGFDGPRDTKGFRPNLTLLAKQERLLEDYSMSRPSDTF